MFLKTNVRSSTELQGLMLILSILIQMKELLN